MEDESHKNWVCLQGEELLQKPDESLKKFTLAHPFKTQKGWGGEAGLTSREYSALIPALYCWELACVLISRGVEMGSWLDKVPHQTTHSGPEAAPPFLGKGRKARAESCRWHSWAKDLGASAMKQPWERHWGRTSLDWMKGGGNSGFGL